MSCYFNAFVQAREAASAYSSSMPSLAFTSACTACGLALPPVAFMTADEPTGKRRLRLHLLDLIWVGGDDLVHGLFDGAGIRHLLHAARLDDFGRVATLVPDDFEHILGDLARNGLGLDEIDNAAQLVGRNRRRLDVLA